MEYYVYAYLNPLEIIDEKFCDIIFNYRPIYIGKGKNNRITSHFSHRKRYKTLFYNKLNKMINNDNTPIITKLKTFKNESDAIEFEKLLISEIGRTKNGGYLYNTTDGGDGVSGYRFSKESISKMIKSRSGKKQTPEWIENRTSKIRGRKMSEEARKKHPNVVKC